MKRVKRWAVLSAFLLVFTGAVPALADPPEVLEEPIFGILLDLKYEVVVFWNTTRDDFCDWADGGFEGPPPIDEPVNISFKETGKGAVISPFRAVRHLEIWHLDDDADLSGPCEATDAQPGPLAVGNGRVGSSDNDLFVSGTRMNTFGHRGQGRLESADGTRWHYSWAFLAQIDRHDEFRVVVDHSNLRQLGR